MLLHELKRLVWFGERRQFFFLESLIDAKARVKSRKQVTNLVKSKRYLYGLEINRKRRFVSQLVEPVETVRDKTIRKSSLRIHLQPVLEKAFYIHRSIDTKGTARLHWNHVTPSIRRVHLISIREDSIGTKSQFRIHCSGVHRNSHPSTRSELRLWPKFCPSMRNDQKGIAGSYRSLSIRTQIPTPRIDPREDQYKEKTPKQPSSIVTTRISHRFRRGSIRNSIRENWQWLVNVRTLTRVRLTYIHVWQANVRFSKFTGNGYSSDGNCNHKHQTTIIQQSITTIHSTTVHITEKWIKDYSFLWKDNSRVLTRHTLGGKCYPTFWQGCDIKELAKNQRPLILNIDYTQAHHGSWWILSVSGSSYNWYDMTRKAMKANVPSFKSMGVRMLEIWSIQLK